MNRQEQRQNLRIRRIKQVARQKMTLLAVITTIILSGSVVCGTILTSAKNPATDIVQHKYYKSIVIEEGDSLWNLAKEYANDDTHAYIKELKQLNGLTSETIHAGQHLIIAYYGAEIQ